MAKIHPQIIHITCFPVTVLTDRQTDMLYIVNRKTMQYLCALEICTI